LSLQHKDQSTKRRAKSDPKGSNAPEVPLKGHAGGHFLRSAPKKTLCGKKYATVLTYWVWGSNGLVVFFLGGGFGNGQTDAGQKATRIPKYKYEYERFRCPTGFH